MSIPAALLYLCLVAVAQAGAPAENGWRQVVPPPDDPFAHPPPRLLALTDSKPPDLKESARYRGARRRYAQLIYGTGVTAAVAVVVDEVAPGQVDLYVDADRNREVTATELVRGEGLTWRVPLTVRLHEGEAVKELPRVVLFRYGRSARTLSVATCGFVEGHLDLDGKARRARRVDGDANGLFADPQDRIWIDLNSDGQWDAAGEVFLIAPILRLDNRRWVVRADACGDRLGLAPLEGTGKLRLALPARIRREQVIDIQVTIQSRDGIAAALRRPDAEMVLPTGEYRVTSLLLTLKDAAGGPDWGFVFRANNDKKDRWHTLKKDATVTVDPIGPLDFSVTTGADKDRTRPGESFWVRPTLYTGDGLLIERAYRGSMRDGHFDAGCVGKVSLVGVADQVLDSVNSGFA